MTPHEAIELFDYNAWANERLLSCAAGLPAEAWIEDLGGAFPTLLGVVAHVVGAERIWLMRCMGETPKGRPAWMADPSPTVLRDVLDEVERQRAAFLRSLREGDLARPISYTLLDGSGATLPLATLLRHAANHSTYHRGQIASMLRRLGAAPPATDLLVFAVAHPRSR
ncbi:MAG TPA: DinB family protein [Longimicrobium sp.]